MTELQRLHAYAAEGDIESQFKLGMLYEEGRRVPKDIAKGLALLEQAAEQGAAFASNTLSTIYMGRGHFTAGMKWLQRAAEQGLANAQGQLGILYSTDKIVPQDDIKACAWLTVGIANGLEKNQGFYDKLRSRLNAQQKLDTEKLIVELLTKLPRIPFREHAEIVGLM